MQNVTNKEDIAEFLKFFKEKKKIWGVIFQARDKNINTLSELEIRPVERDQVLDYLTVQDYCEGPIDEDWYGSKEMWVFGKIVKDHEIYIKITLGAPGSQTICISFHLAEHPMSYPFKA